MFDISHTNQWVLSVLALLLISLPSIVMGLSYKVGLFIDGKFVMKRGRKVILTAATALLCLITTVYAIGLSNTSFGLTYGFINAGATTLGMLIGLNQRQKRQRATKPK